MHASIFTHVDTYTERHIHVCMHTNTHRDTYINPEIHIYTHMDTEHT